jgi:hypothetical protein
LVNGGSVETHESGMGVVFGREVQVKKSLVSLVVARKVRANEVRTVLLAAGKVQGNVQTFFTVWSALAAGLGFGLALLGVGRLWARRPAKGVSSLQKR